MDFSFDQLRSLATKRKNDYMERILNEDAKVSAYVKKVAEKLEDTQDCIYNTQQEIGDIQEDWDHEMVEINNKLYENAVKNGICKEKFKFVTFNIKD